MRAWRVGGTTLVLIALAGLPSARAGTEQDPEIVADCGSGQGSGPYFPWADICSAWFEGMWSPIYDGDGELVDWAFEGLRTTLSVAGGLPERDPRTWSFQLSWDVGSCSHYWSVVDWVGMDDPREGFGKFCDDETSQRVDVPAGNIQYQEDRIVATFPVDGVLSGFRDAYEVGDVLGEPTALIRASVTTAAWQANLDWSRAGPGSDFVIGQDKPPVSGQ